MFTFPIAFFSSSGSTPPAEAFENYYSNDFDGSNDRVDISSLASILQSENTFSVSFWAKASYSNLNPAFVASTGNDADKAFLIYAYDTNAGTHDCRVWYNGASIISTGNNSLTGWNHFCYVQNGATSHTVYINGSSAGTSSTSKTLDSGLDTCDIGGTAEFSQFFTGSIDEVSVFDSALSASDVTAIYNSGSPDSLASQSNLKGWWRMGDGANYPIVKNQAHFSQTAVEFDGSNDYVGGIDSSQFAGASKISISVWAKYQGGNRFIISTEGSANNQFMINTWAGTLYWQVRNGSVTYGSFSFSGLLNVGDWFHLVCTFDGTQSTNADKVKMYFNGTPKTLSFSGTQPTTISSSIGDIDIGRQSTYGSNYWLGNIDDVSIYNSALSSSDVTDIYNSGYPKDESERSGLVSYYKFDGDVYPVIEDALQFSNASLDFDGTNDYVSIGSGFQYSSVSISAWIKFDAISAYKRIIQLGRSGGGTGYGIAVTDSGNQLIGFWSDGSETTMKTSSTVTTGTWYHVTMTFDGTTMKMYLNGSDDSGSAGTGNDTGWASTNDDLEIGRKAGGGQYFTGNIDDVIIFDAELSASDVTGIYNSGKPKDESSMSNLVGYWRMGDNTISPDVPSALGYGTHSVNFDGIDDDIVIPDSASLDLTDTITLSAWIKPASVAGWDGIIYKNNNAQGGAYHMGISNTNKLGGGIKTNAGVWHTVQSSASLQTGVWQHVAVVIDLGNTFCKLYINGSEDGSDTSFNHSIGGNTNPVTIGEGATTGERYSGLIQDAAIFSEAKSASDITSIYNNGLPKDISSESGLVSYYRMGDGEDKYPNILDYKGTNHGTMTNMASDDITTANVGSGTMTNMASDDIVADSPSGTSGQMTNMASDDFVAAKDAGTMVNMTAEDIVADIPS